MYEFTEKKLREKFKKTKYGKKTNVMLYKSLIFVFSMIVVLLSSILLFYIELINKDVFVLIIPIEICLFFISVITACYFDGKRDGAIEQYKNSLK